jgi:hypothetical protein
MIDTSAIDPHWPVDAEDAARTQPSLPLDLGAVSEPRAPEPFAGLTLSKSEIGVLRRCPRRYQYEYVMGRTPAAGPGIEAQWGTALHRGLEALYQDLPVERAIEAVSFPGIEQDGRPYAPPADPYAKAALRAAVASSHRRRSFTPGSSPATHASAATSSTESAPTAAMSRWTALARAASAA